MDPTERTTLYRLAAGTGFRKSELGSLTPECFDLDADPPTVRVTAAYSKRRREDVQPIRRDLADVLRPFLTGREPGRPVFNLPDKTAPMIKADLNAARIPYARGGHVADFHSLRHTFITRLVRSGANVKVVPDLARHSTPTLTLGRYSHVEVMDRRKALDALPSVEPPDEPGREALQATGTTDTRPNALEPLAADMTAVSRPKGARRGTNGHTESGGGKRGKSGLQAGERANRRELARPEHGTPSGNRTLDTRIKSPLLYLAELRAQRYSSGAARSVNRKLGPKARNKRPCSRRSGLLG